MRITWTHRVSVADGKGLSGARLPVGQHRGVVALEATLHKGQRGAPVDLLLGGICSKDVVELPPAVVVTWDHHLKVQMLCSVKRRWREVAATIS